MTHGKIVPLLLVSASSLALAAPAWAQTQGDKGTTSVAELTVTAEKREEKVQDIPLSVSVSTQAQLQSQQVNSVADLNRITPSLEIQQASGQNPGGGGQIRGIGTQTFATGAVGSVGIVVDQVSQGNANITDIFDVARVEVLKGPQGTLFGLTTSAGVINIVTNAPDPNGYSASVHTELSGQGVVGSDYGQQIVQGVVNIPVASNAALRVAASADLRQGVDRNALDGDYTDHSVYSIRGRFFWAPTDRMRVNVIGDYSDATDNGADFFTVTQANPVDSASLAACGVIVRPGNINYCSNRPQTNYPQIYGVSGQIDYDFGPVTLTSITSYRETSSFGGNSDIFRDENNPTQIFTLGASSSSDLVTEEVRLASPNAVRFEYTVGAFFSRYSQNAGGGGINVEVFPRPPGPPPVSGFFIPIVTNGGSNGGDTDRSEAVFGQATYHATDQFRVIFGARFTHETLVLLQTSKNPPFGVSGFGSATENNWSGKVGLQYDFTPDLMAYATVSQGYKGPQLNASNPLVPATIIRPEQPTDVEFGIKNTLFNGNIATDLSVFYDHVKNYQGQQCLPVPTGLACGPVNYTAVNSEGVEFDVFGKVAEGLTVNGGILYNPVKYPAGTLASDGSGNLGGSQLGNAPLWKVTLSGEYRRPISESITGFISLDAVYKSDVNLDNSLDPKLHYPAHWIVGGRLGVDLADGRYRLAVFARNIGDSHEPVLIFPNFPNGGDYGTYYVPQSFRLVGLSLDARF